MSVFKKILFTIPLILILLIGLWPFGSDRNELLVDEQLLKGKREYLQSIQESINTSDTLPNIILIVADDLGVSDIDYVTKENDLTPTLSFLARYGSHFKNAYCTSPICATSRAAILTGRYQNRFGFEFQMQNRYARNRFTLWAMKYLVNSDPWSFKWLNLPPSKKSVSEQGLPKSEITIAEMLKHGAGYKTGLFGKWHLGKQKGRLPLDFGFDYHYGFYNSHSLFIPENTEGYIDIKNEQDWTDQYIWADQRDGLSAIVRNDTIIDENGYLTDRIAQETISFIKKHKDERFFTMVNFNAPHTPLQAPEEFYNRYAHIEDPVKRVYAAMINNMDLNIGKIYNYLNNSNLLMNTIFIITSDNGGARYAGVTENTPYKGGKINQFEGGLRVPFIVAQVNRFLNSDVIERVSTLDIFSSIASLAKVPLPSDRKIDGTPLPIGSRMPDNWTIEHKKTKVPISEDLVGRNLHWAVGKNNAIIEGDYKLIYSEEDHFTPRLYDLSVDSTEQNNIASKFPDKVRELKSLQSKWRQEMPAPLWPGVVKFKVEDDEESVLFES